MRFERPRPNPWRPLAVALALAALLAGALVLAPRVASVSPGEGEQIPANAQLRIRFNQAMDRTSVEARLQITPQVAGQVSWEGETLVFAPREPWPEGEQVQVRLAAGARSRFFLPMLRGRQWSFGVRRPRVAYLWPNEGAANLYARSLEDGETVALTDEAFGLTAYAVDYSRARLIYLARREDGGQDFKWLDLQRGESATLASCSPGNRCRELRIDPSGRWLAFEQVALIPTADGQWAEGGSSVWVLDLEEKAEAMAISPPGEEANQPRWSSQGLLAFYNQSRQAIWVVQPQQGPEPPRLQSTTSRLGILGDWSPGGDFLLFPEVAFVAGESFGPGEEAPVFFSHLIRWSVESGLRQDLSGEEAGLVEDSAPAYSPDGGWIAFARRSLQEVSWTQGRQLWLMRADGSQARPLTAAGRYHHLAFSWKGDGQALLYMRTDRQDLAAPPEIWFYNLQADQAQRIAVGGFAPQWIP